MTEYRRSKWPSWRAWLIIIISLLAALISGYRGQIRHYLGEATDWRAGKKTGR